MTGIFYPLARAYILKGVRPAGTKSYYDELKQRATPYFKQEVLEMLKNLHFVKKYWELFAQYNN